MIFVLPYGFQMIDPLPVSHPRAVRGVEAGRFDFKGLLFFFLWLFLRVVVKAH